MTVTTESDPRLSAWMCVRIGVTGIANRSSVAVPVPFDIMHKKGRVRFGIVSLYAIWIIVTNYASRVRSLGIMAACATLYVLSCVLGMSSTAAADSQCGEVSTFMPDWFYPRTVRI
jgi:hypothetical protein